MDRAARQAFEETALPHLDSLYGVALRMTRDRAAAEDLVQDTMVRAYRFWHRFEPGTSVRAWLFTILRNTFVNTYHRDNRERARTAELATQIAPLERSGAAGLSGAPPSPDQAVAAKVAAEEIRAALAELPEDYRLAVLLADLEGLAYKEIAAVMECPIGTVMSRLYRGRRLLKKALEDRIDPRELAPSSPLISLDAFRKRGHA
ncbi:MAG: sigma-70 family RNA polymerase sigma factor [Myxococcales bacterium]|nr:sigma-70 family RNA polymerase sigma factor [Myxococcales bacterium]